MFALLRGFVFLIPSFVLLPEVMGATGVWLALCLSELLTTVVIATVYGMGAVKRRKYSARPGA